MILYYTRIKFSFSKKVFLKKALFLATNKATLNTGRQRLKYKALAPSDMNKQTFMSGLNVSVFAHELNKNNSQQETAEKSTRTLRPSKFLKDRLSTALSPNYIINRSFPCHALLGAEKTVNCNTTKAWEMYSQRVVEPHVSASSNYLVLEERQ